MKRMKEKRTALHFRRRGLQRGVGLIEVLVALIVLSIGFLVSANMQLRGMRSNQHAFYQSQATMLLSEMMDRMRNNRAGVSAGHYDDVKTKSMTKPTCVSSGCDEEGVATLDLYEWSANLISLRGESDFIPLLPPNVAGDPAQGSISDPDVNGVYTLSMTWTQVDGVDTTAESVEVKFVP